MPKLTNTTVRWSLLGTSESISPASIYLANAHIRTIWIYQNGWKALSPNEAINVQIDASTGVTRIEGNISENSGFWVEVK